MANSEVSGFRVWFIKEDGTPKEVCSGTKEDIYLLDYLNIYADLDNETYAIRFGKGGRK